MKITKKAMLAKLASGTVQATLVGGRSVEDWPNMVASIKEAYPEAKEQDDKIEFDFGRPGVCRVLLKPRLNRVRNGRFKANSSSYFFEWDGQSSSGDVSSLKLLDDGTGLEMETIQGSRIQYRLAVAAA